MTTGAISRAKLQPNHHHQQTNIQFFTGRMHFLSPNQQSQSTEGKNITFHGFAYPKLTWGLPTLSLTTSSSWLPWSRVAMPLISSLMSVPHNSPSRPNLTSLFNGSDMPTKIRRTVFGAHEQLWLMSCLPVPVTPTDISGRCIQAHLNH